MSRVSKRLRYEILRRDGFKCRYCGAVAAETELRVDHVVPTALGGSSEPSNLATACDPCNSGKSSVPPDAPVVDQVADDALRWAAAMERAAADMEAKLKERDGQNAVFLDEWNSYASGGQHLPLDPTWNATLVRLRTAGLTDRLIIEAVSATMGAQKVLPENRFRYFCGVSWNMITQLQEAAGITTADGGDDGDTAYYPHLDRWEVDETLAKYEFLIEQFLKRVPSWLAGAAEQLAQEDFEKAEESDATRTDVLPQVLRHAGDVLSECTIEYGAPKGDS